MLHLLSGTRSLTLLLVNEKEDTMGQQEQQLLRGTGVEIYMTVKPLNISAHVVTYMNNREQSGYTEG